MKKVQAIVLDWHGVLDQVSPQSLRFQLLKWILISILSLRFQIAWQLLLLACDKYSKNLEAYSCNRITPKIFWSHIQKQCGPKLSKQIQKRLMQIEINQDLIAFLKSLKNQYDLYILSDCGQDKAAIILDQLPALKFKQIVFSCDYQCSKRDGKLFQKFLQLNQIKAQECLFLDDSATNIKIAQGYGFQTHHFLSSSRDIQQIKNKLSI